MQWKVNGKSNIVQKCVTCGNTLIAVVVAVVVVEETEELVVRDNNDAFYTFLGHKGIKD